MFSVLTVLGSCIVTILLCSSFLFEMASILDLAPFHVAECLRILTEITAIVLESGCEIRRQTPFGAFWRGPAAEFDSGIVPGGSLLGGRV
jgi:hypothetical protein